MVGSGKFEKRVLELELERGDKIFWVDNIVNRRRNHISKTKE